MKKRAFKKLTVFFESLASKPRLGGFRISDSSLQYLSLEEEDKPKTFSVKLPPGVISGGKIQDEKSFLYYARELHGLILPEEAERKIRTVVCLPSAVVYTQNYSIPNVGKKQLRETAELNLEMISPVPAEEAYMSWQLIKETVDKFEILGAFAESKVVNKFRNLIERAGFSPMIFEFPSLSLSWTINNEFGPKKESFLILSISGDGIDLFLLRNGSIYFDYFRSWRSIQGGGKRISREDFNRAVVEEIQKVANFSSSRFSENLKYVFVMAPGMGRKVEDLVERSFRVQAAPLRVGIKPLSSSWYTVLGSAVRGNWDRGRDRYINLGMSRVKDLLFQEQVMDFINLWRNIFVGVAAVFLILTLGSYFLLNTQPQTLKERLNIFSINFERGEVVELKNSVKEFNNLVSAIHKVKGRKDRTTGILETIEEVTEGNEIIVDSINVPSEGDVISLSGRAPSHEKVIEFKNVLVNDSRFAEVKMPFSKIFTSEGNFANFEVSFKYNG